MAYVYIRTLKTTGRYVLSQQEISVKLPSIKLYLKIALSLKA